MYIRGSIYIWFYYLIQGEVRREIHVDVHIVWSSLCELNIRMFINIV